MSKLKIREISNKPIVDLVLDTLEMNKQALVFVNSKKSAEKTAEEIAKTLKETKELREIAYQLEIALPRPTSQCVKLGECAKKGVVFHHAGLVSKQRELIEDKFRSGEIKIICSTPTLAFGVDTPAFRAIIKDLRRYSDGSLDFIPVMEYHQMAGRAGRPGKEKFGEAIIFCGTEKDKETAIERFIKGDPEEILSKLAVEPVLRTYLLSLIATEFVKNYREISEFFSKTFWAHQFEDMDRMDSIIRRMLKDLELWGFLEFETKEKKKINDPNGNDKGNEQSEKKNREDTINLDFVSALKLKLKRSTDDTATVNATLMGKRVAELYLDPLTAHEIIQDLHKASNKNPNEFTFLFSICKTLEMRPLVSAKTKDYETLSLNIEKYSSSIVDDIPEEYDEEYPDFLNVFKTSQMIKKWLDEEDEDDIMKQFDVRPGEIHSKITNGDWLLYSMEEICRILNLKPLLSQISKTRIRLKYGVKEELLRLLKIKNVGRIRARKLYNSGLTDIGKVRKCNINLLARIVGPNIAINIKEQLGEKMENELDEESSKDRGVIGKDGRDDQGINEEKIIRRGQHSLLDY